MRNYGNIHASFWTSKTIGALSDDGRMLAVYLLTSPHANMLGCFRLPTAYACEDIRWSPERLEKGFEELSRNGFVTVNAESKWIVIEKFLKWNPFENPNVGKAAAKMYAQIPDDCGVKNVLADRLREFGKNLSKDFLDGLTPPSDTVSSGKNNGIDRVPEDPQEQYRNPEPNQNQNLNQNHSQNQNQQISPAEPGDASEAPKKPRAASRKTPLPADFGISERVREWAAEKGHRQLERRHEHFVSTAKAKGYRYVDWDQAFMNAIRDDWARIGGAPDIDDGGAPQVVL